MLLRTKIILGFSLVLLLTAITGVSAMYLTSVMSAASSMAGDIDNSRSLMQAGLVSTVRYTAFNDEADAELAKRLLTESRSLAQRASQSNTDPALAATFAETLALADKVLGEFEQLRAENRKVNASLAQAAALYDKMRNRYDKLLENVEALVRSLLDQDNISLLVRLNGIRDIINEQVRAGLLAYTMFSSGEAEQTVMTAITKSQEEMRGTVPMFKVRENRAMFESLLASYDEYCDHAVSYLHEQSALGDLQRAFRADLDKFGGLLEQLSLAGINAVQEADDTANAAAMVLLALALTAGVATALFISSNVMRQLGKDPGQLNILAGRVVNGDYDIDDGSRKLGVYGALVEMGGALRKNIDMATQESEHAREQSARAQEAMKEAEAAGADARAKRDGMLVVAERLEEVSNVVSSASTELAAQIEQSERGAAEQAARVTETATAMEEMNSTVLEVARNAGNASEVSASTREKAEHGAAVVQEVVASIQGVQEASVALKNDMAALDDNARAISQIMAVISDIADQTNLLALNAAIEAARAGEAGRGFAVVADEVRKLAEKTMASTTDVGNAIKAIQDSAAKSMDQVDLTVGNIEKATELAIRSGDALREIVGMVDDTADQVRGIAAASEQQSASSEEINKSIMQVNTIAGETASAMQEAARAVSELAEQAQVLTGLIRELKNA